MAELKSMKMAPKEAKKAEEAFIDRDPPRFPFGLRVSLNDESLDKLGMKELPKVGEQKSLVAMVEVVEVSEHDSAGGKPRRRVELQITDMVLEKDKKKLKDIAAKLYG